jgi:eukaryotic-like serine/threonine-protein kinase
MTVPSTTPAGGSLLLDDRYRLIEQVGSGGMSVVWRGHDEILGREVAVKLLAPSLGADPAFPRRLLLEARAVATLSHPHITNVYDFGVHRADDGESTPYLVMELLDGQLLSQELRRGRLPWREAVRVCAELAAALAAAHERGIVHRDVSPANVMLTRAGVKVLDFGISALVGGQEIGPDGEVRGTAAYLAPERLRRGEVTAAADVYAAGLVLYRCLAGRLPWDAETVAEILQAHDRVEPRRLPPLGLPRAVEDVCYQCLSREPHHRPSSAELAQILSREVHLLSRELHRTVVATPRRAEPAARPMVSAGGTMTLPLVRRMRGHLPPRRVLAGAAALCGVVAFGYATYHVGPRPAAAQAPNVEAVVPCSIAYTVNNTGDHQFEAALTVINTAGESANRWTLRFTLPGGESVLSIKAAEAAQQVVYDPTAHAAQQGNQVTVTSLSTLDAGASVSQTLNGRYVEEPTDLPRAFTLNGKRCDATITTRVTAPPSAQPVTVTQATTLTNSPPDKHKQEKSHRKHPRSHQ